MKLNIVKRDSRIKAFDMERIQIAIKKAYEDYYGNDEKFIKDYKIIAPEIEKNVYALGKDRIFIEEIQDIVVKALTTVDTDIADSYEDYRERRRIERDKNSEAYKKLDKILQCSDVMNSNANVDEHSFGGRKFESANVILKRYALDKMIKPEIAKAHMENRIYIHDLDSYAIGMHNCSFPDIKKLINKGFITRNGDVRGASGLSTAFQLVAVIFQIQSQEQFGGTGSCHLDYDLEEQVDISFKKHFADALYYFDEKEINWKELDEEICIENSNEIKRKYPKEAAYALRELDREGMQAAQGLYHNLNTLESRPGSQVPFTSINFGRRTTVAGRMISNWILKASLDGIGKHHKTSIFPISIFQYKKGVNDNPESPNYDLKRLAIESMSKRIYPNWVNCDWSKNIEDPNNPDTFMATMGCRTIISYDRHGMGYSKVGRGNVTPVTINLVKVGIKHGICLGERESADIEGFWEELEELLELSAEALYDRFKHICSQSAKSAPFMYKNKSMLGGEYDSPTCVYDVMKHGSQAIGYAGIAEMCQALFGKDHADDEKVHEFALSVVKRISDFAAEASEKYNLNFGCYAAPIESTCGTIISGNREVKGLREEFGIIENVTDRDWITNSHHVPVWKNVDVFTKLRLEAPFTKYPTSGCITYVELDSAIAQNPVAIEQIIDYAFSLDIPYLAFNFPIDTCLDCGYQGEFNDRCPICKSTHIEQLRRVTGYLTTDYHNFNKAKQAEVKSRFKHSTITKL